MPSLGPVATRAQKATFLPLSVPLTLSLSVWPQLIGALTSHWDILFELAVHRDPRVRECHFHLLSVMAARIVQLAPFHVRGLDSR